MWCEANPSSPYCLNDGGPSWARAPLGSYQGRATAWEPGTFPLRGSSSSQGTVSCACMKQCACTVGYNKWECRCVDENQRPVGPGSATPTKIIRDGSKKDECGCLCTENNDGGSRRRSPSDAIQSSLPRRVMRPEPLLDKIGQRLTK